MGCSVILCSERPTPPLIADLFERYKPTVFFAVPAVFPALVEYARQGNKLETSSIKFCVSAGEVRPGADGDPAERGSRGRDLHTHAPPPALLASLPTLPGRHPP